MVFQWDRVVEEEAVMKGLESASDGESSLHLFNCSVAHRALGFCFVMPLFY